MLPLRICNMQTVSAMSKPPLLVAGASTDSVGSPARTLHSLRTHYALLRSMCVVSARYITPHRSAHCTRPTAWECIVQVAWTAAHAPARPTGPGPARRSAQGTGHTSDVLFGVRPRPPRPPGPDTRRRPPSLSPQAGVRAAYDIDNIHYSYYDYYYYCYYCYHYIVVLVVVVVVVVVLVDIQYIVIQCIS